MNSTDTSKSAFFLQRKLASRATPYVFALLYGDNHGVPDVAGDYRGQFRN